MVEENFNFEKLAREIVVTRLAELPNAPEAAAEIAKKILVTGILGTKGRQDPHLTVTAVCRGVMSGMLLLNKDLSEPAVQILMLIPNIAHDVPIDPGDLMTWAMEGIAAVAKMGGVPVEDRIRERIEENFMGAGSVFSELCAKQTL